MVDRMQAYRRHGAQYSLPLGLPIERTLNLDLEQGKQGSIVPSSTPSSEDIVSVNGLDMQLLPLKRPARDHFTSIVKDQDAKHIPVPPPLPTRSPCPPPPPLKKMKSRIPLLPGGRNKEELHKEIQRIAKATKPVRKSNFKSLSKLSRQKSNQSSLGHDTCLLLPSSLKSISNTSYESQGESSPVPENWDQFQDETVREQEIYRKKTSRDVEDRVRGRQFDFDKVKEELEHSGGGRASVNNSRVYETASSSMASVRSSASSNHGSDDASWSDEEAATTTAVSDDEDQRARDHFTSIVKDQDAKHIPVPPPLPTRSPCPPPPPPIKDQDAKPKPVSPFLPPPPLPIKDQDAIYCAMPDPVATVPPPFLPPHAPPAPPPMTIEEIKQKAKNEKQMLRSVNSHPLKHHRGILGKERIAKKARKLLLNQMFEMIRRPSEDGDYEEMKAFLNCHGAEVEWIPKVGCDPESYKGDLNITNMSDDFQNTPLLIACKMGPPREDIAILLLKFGANPNHVDNIEITNKCGYKLGDSALECAAKSYWRRDDIFIGNTVRNQSELMEQLVLYGADLSEAVVHLCNKLMQPHEESFDSMMALCALVDPSLLMLTEEPIETAHKCSVTLRNTGKVKDEYQTDCLKLAEEADKFALSYLDSCNKLWEARTLLSKRSILENALRQRQKSFVAHPFCQELLLEEWYGGLEFRGTTKLIGLLFTYFFGSFLIPYYAMEMLIKNSGYRYTRLDDHMHKLLTPYLCFVADALNFLILLVLLIAVCLTLDQEQDLTTPTYLEIVMWLCLLTRFMIEFNQWCCNKRYFTNFWNYVDMLLVGFLGIAIVYRLVACYVIEYSCETGSRSRGNYTIEQCTDQNVDWQKRHALNVIYIYSCSEIVLFLRLLNMLDITYTLGPLQLAVKRMLGDVVKLVVLLSTVVIAFSISISAIMRYAVLKSPPDSEDEKVSGFTSIVASSLTLFWSLFDLADVDALTIKGDKTSTFLTKLLFGLYLIIAVVIMLNMLIAMLNNTYQSIWTNQDVVWKFSRAKLFKEYRKGIPFVFPFLLILYPIIMGYRWHNRKQKKVMSPKFNIHSMRTKGSDETDAGRTLSVDSDSKNDDLARKRYMLSGILSQRYADKNNMKHSYATR